MASGFLCGLFCSRPRPAPGPTSRDGGLDGVQFSPRTSMASSNADVPPSAPAAGSSAAPPGFTTNLTNPELAGYYSPPAPQPVPRADPSRELRGYYAPDPITAAPPAPRQQTVRHPAKTTYS
ncbi:hypothetical protein M426DRAFT_9182 [Hypoxylon sp. CI-4A]|nr:hypothetical protein M426DRAFT_9182 [Hypoxylon sp. CI-4A]